MTLTTKVGQIFLEHPKDENYASVYEETFRKQGQSVQLFSVMEVSGSGPGDIRAKKPEYEALARSLVAAFKKTFVSSVTTGDETFERALGTVNATLGRLGAKGRISWFGKLNAALAAFTNNELFLSVTGNAIVYLERGGDLTLLSEGLAEDSKPIKIFSNFAAGKLTRRDRVILSTKQLFNYLSFDKIREKIKTGDLEDVCHEIISALTDVKNIGFATFIFETLAAGQEVAEKVSLPLSPSSGPKVDKFGKGMLVTGNIIRAIFEMLATAGQLVVGFFSQITRKKSATARKKIVLAVAAVLVLLFASIGFSIWKKAAQDKQKIENANLTRAENLINEAEAAAIYQDDSRVINLTEEAQRLLSEIKSADSAEKQATLQNRLTALKDQTNKEVSVENFVSLASFTMIPTDILRSPNGFLAVNRNTGSLAFYDFRSGEAKDVLKSVNLSSLVMGGFLGQPHDYVFLNRAGKFSKVDLSADQIVEFPTESPNLPDFEGSRIQDASVLGEGLSARIYFLDTRKNQIWRFRVTETQIGPAEGWLKENVNFAESVDLSVDNNIYVLFADRLERYFNGAKQTFALSAVSPALKTAQKIFTTSEQQMIYLLDPTNERILVYNKSGRLQSQLKSGKFRDAADLFVDEKNKIVYLISGQQLLQINF